jgi:predicted nuclease with TOPRIM domain
MHNEKMFELADELKTLRDTKAALEDELKSVNAKIDDTDYRLSEVMAEDEVQNFTRAGVMFCLTTKTRASASAGLKDDLFVALRENGLGDIITETVNANTLSSAVKGLIEENGDTLPAWLDGLVNVFDKTTVSVRKSTKH